MAEFSEEDCVAQSADSVAAREDLGNRRRTCRTARSPIKYGLGIAFSISIGCPMLAAVAALVIDLVPAIDVAFPLPRPVSVLIFVVLFPVWFIVGLLVLRYRRNLETRLHVYADGLVITSAKGMATAFPWESTLLITDGRGHFKLGNRDGMVATFGGAGRAPLIGGERIRGMPTVTVVKSAVFPHSDQWAPAIRRGVLDAQYPMALSAVKTGIRSRSVISWWVQRHFPCDVDVVVMTSRTGGTSPRSLSMRLGSSSKCPPRAGTSRNYSFEVSTRYPI